MGTKVRKTHLTKGKITLLCMTIPSVLFILVFSYFPISGWIYSFFDYRIGYKLSKCEFVGLDNFIYAFGDPYIITVILNTADNQYPGTAGAAAGRDDRHSAFGGPGKKIQENRADGDYHT